MHRQRLRQPFGKAGSVEHGRVGDADRRIGYGADNPLFPKDNACSQWCDVLLGEWHGDAAFDPSPVCAYCHLSRGTQGDGVLRHLHFDAMQSDARIGYCGAMHLESRLQTGWECEKRGCLPFFRRIPVATDSDCVECDDQQLAYQRGTVIHVPILVRSGEGYGKLFRRERRSSSRRTCRCSAPRHN